MELEENAIIKEIKSVFESDNEGAIHDAIAYIHENGSTKMVPLLFDLLENTSNEKLKKDVFDCLMDTKDESVIPLFIEALQNQDLINERKQLLSTIWQANLDFSKHADVFANILIDDNYENSLEAFTILEVCAEKISAEEKSKLKERLSAATTNDKSEKKILLQEAVKMLE